MVIGGGEPIGRSLEGSREADGGRCTPYEANRSAELAAFEKVELAPTSAKRGHVPLYGNAFTPASRRHRELLAPPCLAPCRTDHGMLAAASGEEKAFGSGWSPHHAGAAVREPTSSTTTTTTSASEAAGPRQRPAGSHALRPPGPDCVGSRLDGAGVCARPAMPRSVCCGLRSRAGLQTREASGTKRRWPGAERGRRTYFGGADRHSRQHRLVLSSSILLRARHLCTRGPSAPAPVRRSYAGNGGPRATPGKQSRSPPNRPLNLRCRPPRCPPRQVLFGAVRPSSSAGFTRSIRSSVPAARA